MYLTHLKVAPVVINGMAGFQIQGMFRDTKDGMFEPLAHAAVFRDRARAERALVRCDKVLPWERNWSVWGKAVGTCLSNTDAIQAHAAVYSVL